MRAVLIVMLALAAGTVMAETATSDWAKEPEAVLGIKLGVPLADSRLPTCPEYHPGQWTPPTDICVSGTDSPYADRIRTLEGLPWGDIAIRGSVFLFEGKVQSIDFDLRQSDFETFKEILITRYGPPGKTDASTVTSKGGAVVGSKILRWTGKTVSIVLIERSGRIDRSGASISHNALVQQAEDARKSTIEKDASKL